MAIPIGSLFDILGAIDVSKDPNTEGKNNKKSGEGRLIEQDQEDGEGNDDESHWHRKNRETARCLKLALKCCRTGELKVGIELEPINWNLNTDSLIGKQMRLTRGLDYYQGNVLLLTNANCEVLPNSSSGSLRPPTGLRDQPNLMVAETAEFMPFSAAPIVSTSAAPVAVPPSVDFDFLDDDTIMREIIDID